MQTGIESLVKLGLIALLVLAGLGVWLLPKTGWMKQRRINERLFVLTCAAGIFCGAAGLLVTFAWPQRVFEWHLWEAAAMPLVLLYAYWIIVMRNAGTSEVLDEKQESDLTNASALASALAVPAMGAAFVLQEKGWFDGSLWFPYFLFVTLLIQSIVTLVRFKQA